MKTSVLLGRLVRRSCTRAESQDKLTRRVLQKGVRFGHARQRDRGQRVTPRKEHTFGAL